MFLFLPKPGCTSSSYDFQYALHSATCRIYCPSIECVGQLWKLDFRPIIAVRSDNRMVCLTDLKTFVTIDIIFDVGFRCRRVSSGPMQLFDADNVALCAIVVACLQFSFFVAVCKLRIQKVVDIAGGITFCAVALSSLCVGQVGCHSYLSHLSVSAR